MSVFTRGIPALAWAIVVTSWALSPASAEGAVPLGADPIKVYLDQAKLLKLPDGTATLVVGNPLIADVAVQPGGTLVITGKGYGNTNLIALDRGGSVMMEHQIEVQGAQGSVVVVQRGVDRETYSCTPNCQRRITLGDSQTYFAGTLGQSGTLNTQAGAAQQPK